MMQRIVLLALCLFVIVTCGGKSVVGKYRIEQDAGALGEGAEHAQLDLRQDKSFSIEIGPLTLAKGTWTEKEGKVDLSVGTSALGTSYRVDNGNLIPQFNGKDVKIWRFTRLD